LFTADPNSAEADRPQRGAARQLNMKSFDQLTEQELLALAISSEEEDGRIYADFAEGLRDEHPDTAKIFSDMSAEENEHRRALIELYLSRFGNHIPLVRRQDVRGFVQRKKLWRVRLQGIEAVRQQARQMEQDARRLYDLAASRTTDASIRIARRPGKSRIAT
jgi:rubrerythrin